MDCLKAPCLVHLRLADFSQNNPCGVQNNSCGVQKPKDTDADKDASTAQNMQAPAPVSIEAEPAAQTVGVQALKMP